MLWRDNFEKHPITSTQIDELLKKVARENKKCYIETTDRMYLTTDIDTIKKVVSLMPIKYFKYTKEEFDCENYAILFKGICNRLLPYLPIGYCHITKSDGAKHALCFCIYITKNGRLAYTYIEPQTNKVTYFDYVPYLMIV